MLKKNRLVLIDGSGYIFRAYYALPPMNRSDGTPINAVYGFTKAALNVFSKRKKTHNEKYEDIELLRFLDLGCKVKMSETVFDSIAVDVPSDVKKVENFLDKNNLP